MAGLPLGDEMGVRRECGRFRGAEMAGQSSSEKLLSFVGRDAMAA